MKDNSPWLILIQPDRFDPAVDPDTYVHPTWARWPEPFTEDRDNRILSLLSGHSWRGESGDFAFDHLPPGNQWRSRGFATLSTRGYFNMRRENLPGVKIRLVTPILGVVNRLALLLSLDGSSPVVKANSIEEAFHSLSVVQGLSIMAANGGEDIRSIVRQTSGRILVVEYPPRAAQNWSRIWLLNRSAWPGTVPTDSEHGVSGLIPAERLGRLIVAPTTVDWSRKGIKSPPPNRWMQVTQSAGPMWAFGCGLAISGLIATGFVFVSQEKSSRSLAFCMRNLLLIPGATLLAGSFCRWGGLSGLSVWLGISFLLLVGAAMLMDQLAARFSIRNRWIGVALLGFVTLSVTNPVYSLISPVFSRGPVHVPGMLYGSLVGLFAIVGSIVANRHRLGEFGSIGLATALGVCSLFGIGWWHAPDFQIIPWKGSGWPDVALWGSISLATLPICRARNSVLRGFALLMIGTAFVRGIQFIPLDLLQSQSQRSAINAFEWLNALFSPLFFGAAFLIGGIALFSSRFVAHQFHQAWRSSPTGKALVRCSVLCLVAAIAQPELLSAAIVVSIFAGIVVMESLIEPSSME